MNAEIVTIGTELLLGQIIDTNAAYIADQFNRIGVSVLYKSTVGDNAGRMREVLTRALERADVVITSGGLGPTEDDLTRQIAAEVTNRKLVLHQDLLEQIQRIFRNRRYTFNDNNVRQAYIPEGAIPIENPQGTAPGYIIEDERGIVVSLPGVPREMKYLMQQTVLPYLRQKQGASHVITYKILKLCGIGESTVDYTIRDLIQTSTNPSIGLLAHPGQVDIRIAAKAESVEQAAPLIEQIEAHIRERLPTQIYGTDDDTQESMLCRLLHEREVTLALAETNTGGHIGQRLTSVPHSEPVFCGGIVASGPQSLQRLLPIPAEHFTQHDMHSMDTAICMAHAVKEQCGTDIGMGLTGLRQSREGHIAEPAAPSYCAVCTEDGTVITQEYHVSGSPEVIQTRVSNSALEFLRRILLGIAGEHDSNTPTLHKRQITP